MHCLFLLLLHERAEVSHDLLALLLNGLLYSLLRLAELLLDDRLALDEPDVGEQGGSICG